jgi:uncharacterized repeat protein (TIGR03803 family)
MTLAVGLTAGAVAVQLTQAQTTYKTLYSFNGTDGSDPMAGLIRDGAGNLCGTTESGGAFGFGIVFKVTAAGAERSLYSFSGGTDGAYPIGLAQDGAGNFYATCAGGGTFGHGALFKINIHGAGTVFYSFTGGTDGGSPQGSLIRDATGNFYGTTALGGSGYGTVFKVDSTGNETVLYSFTGQPDGSNPYSGLIRDTAGNLYGTTGNGGAYGFGTVFKVDPTDKETVLYSFTGAADGSLPEASLIRDPAGNIYGTTFNGGVFSTCQFSPTCGTVFKLNATGKETVLHSFGEGADGASPRAGLIVDAAGILYGTTQEGGANQAGTVFKLDKAGNETVLFNLGGNIGGSEAGGYPFAQLIRDTSGNLYGTTLGGGAHGFGAVFELTFP